MPTCFIYSNVAKYQFPHRTGNETLFKYSKPCGGGVRILTPNQRLQLMPHGDATTNMSDKIYWSSQGLKSRSLVTTKRVALTLHHGGFLFRTKRLSSVYNVQPRLVYSGLVSTSLHSNTRNNETNML